jgi:5'-nucleotidase/UDP-sugar diphosphatase
MDKVYRLATNNYLAMGGDGYEVLSKNGDKGYDTGFVAADVLRGYIEHLGIITEYTSEARYNRK